MMKSLPPGLVECLPQDVAGEIVDLDVHLHGGHALFGPADLEVHVAGVVFIAEDIGEDDHLVALLQEPHGDPGDGGADRNPGIHQGEASTADGGHRRRPVGREDVGDDPDGVGKLLLGRQDGRSALRDRPPWPISRLPGLRRGLASPTQ